MIFQGGKQRVFELLEPAPLGDCMGRAFDLAIICLLAVNVVGAILRTVGRFSQSYGAFFDLFEYATVAVFTTEYLARLWVSDLQCKAPCLTPSAKRVRYALSPHGLVDLLAFLPFYVTLLVTVDSRLAHVLPVLRVLKYMRYSPALETLGMVVYNERRTLTAAAGDHARSPAFLVEPDLSGGEQCPAQRLRQYTGRHVVGYIHPDHSRLR